MNLMNTSSGQSYNHRAAPIPVTNIVIENRDDRFPTQWKMHRESQVINVHIPMNCKFDKLTILLYGRSVQKLQIKKPLLIVRRGFSVNSFVLSKEFDTERIASFLIIQEPQGIGDALVENIKADQDHGENADKGEDSHKQLVSITLFEEDQTRRKTNNQTEHTCKQCQGDADLEIQHLASVFVDLVAAILEPGPDHQRDQNDAEHTAQMQSSHH